MVDMGMGEDEVVNLLGVEAEVTVHGVGLEAFALIHAAVEQDFQTFLSGY